MKETFKNLYKIDKNSLLNLNVEILSFKIFYVKLFGDKVDQNYINLMKERKDLFSNDDMSGITVATDFKEIDIIEKRMMRNYISEGYPKEWAKVGVVFKDKYITIIRDAVLFNKKFSGVYDRIISFNENGYHGVAIVPVYNEKIVLINNFRHSVRKWQVEIPMGFLENGISLEDNAIKEISEEISGKVSSLESIGEVLIDSGISNKKVKLYYAELLSFGECCDNFEAIKNITAYSMSEIESMINKNIIIDNITIGSIYKYKIKKQLL